jgi:hypothetical protein
MGIRTTVTLDEDVLERLKHESKTRGLPLRHVLNESLRKAFLTPDPKRREFQIAGNLKFIPGLNYDKTEEVLEFLEGPDHR